MQSGNVLENETKNTTRSMNNCDPELIISISNDSAGRLPRAAIDHDKSKELKNLIINGLDVALKRTAMNGDNCLQYAARKNSRACVKVLLDHYMLTLTHGIKIHNFNHSLGLLFFLACSEKKENMAIKIHKIIKRNNMDCTTWFRHKDDNGYTALHWAARNGLQTLCALFFQDYTGGFYFQRANLPAYRKKNKDGCTPFDMAIAHDQQGTVNILAKAISLDYILAYSNAEILYRIFLLDLTPDCFSNRESVTFRSINPDYSMLMKISYNFINQLTTKEEKTKYLEKIVQGTGILGLIFSRGGTKKREYYKKLIAQNIIQNKSLKTGEESEDSLISLNSSIRTSKSWFGFHSSKSERSEQSQEGRKEKSTVPVSHNQSPSLLF